MPDFRQHRIRLSLWPLIVLPVLARAQEVAPGGVNPICTDRPTKSVGPCTVDDGHFQYEADIANYTYQRLDGVTTETWLLANPTLKYGISPDADVEATFSPLEVVTTRGRSAGDRTLIGISDLFLRLKYRFLSLDDGNLQTGLLPYVKLPTARSGIGNGAVEGGFVLPVSYQLNATISVTVSPELDILADSAGSGTHPNTSQLVNLGVSLPNNVTLYAEIWADWDYDPSAFVQQYSFDPAVAYDLNPSFQLDAGVNIGLNRYTPGIQAYVGMSQRF